jgi:uncharacterized protein (TIGR03435 family)
MLIEYAFGVQQFQISGGPPWIHDDRFNIEAIPPSTSKSSAAKPTSPKAPLNQEQREMLQALLFDRFQLKIHHEAKTGPVYLLTVGNGPLKLKEAKDKGDFSWVGGPEGGMISGNGIAGENVSMPVLAERLSRYLKVPVVDRTGLKGFFDFRFEYGSADPAADLMASIIDSVRGIGLKLRRGRGLVDTISVDHAAKPAAN